MNACSSDASPTANANGSGDEADGGGGDIYKTVGVAPPAASADGTATPVPYRYDQVKSPYDDGDAAACKAFSSDDLPAGFKTDERSCLCDSCFMIQRECDALIGCQQIMNCILSIGCTDSNSCYLAPQKTALDPDAKGCVDVIDKWGNSGVSTALSNQIGDCGKMNGCLMAPAAQ
ncbi:MAG TPA: hypothetical protein VH062_15935 [Polyangiaceae bacterium]|nr:hypothetical protein [Polyangiaceae bacterium]